MTTVRRRFARDAATLSVQALVQRALGMGTSVILARGLGVDGLGALNAIQTTATNAFGVGRLGLDVATHVHLAEVGADPARKGRIVAAAAVAMSASASGLAGACWLGAGWLARVVFEEPAIAGWLRLSSLLVLAQFGHQFGYSALAGLHAFGRYARVAVAVSLATLLATAVGVWAAGLTGAVAATIAAALAGAVWLTWEVARGLRASGISAGWLGAGGALRDLLRLGGPFYLTGLVLIPVAYGLQGLLTRTGGLEEMGYLRVMLSIGAIVSFLPSSLIGATVSSLALLRTDPSQDAGAYARHAALNLRLVWLFCLLAVLSLGVVLEPLVRILFGEAYVPAVPAFRWGLFGAMLLAVEGVVGQVLLAGRRVWLLFALLTGRAAAFVVLGAVLIPALAVNGYLAADAIALALFVPAGVTAIAAPAARAGGGRDDAARLLLLAALTAGAAAAVLPAWPETLRAVLALTALAAAAGGGYALVLDADERRALGAALGRILGVRARKDGHPARHP